MIVRYRLHLRLTIYTAALLSYVSTTCSGMHIAICSLSLEIQSLRKTWHSTSISGSSRFALQNRDLSVEIYSVAAAEFTNGQFLWLFDGKAS